MSREKKQQKLFREFIDYQLKPFNLTYDNVKEDPQWYMRYSTTQEKEIEFKNYIIERCIKVLKLTKREAKEEAGWFILQWGLTTNSPISEKLYKEANQKKKS
jgi:hypothetical protein